MFHGSLGISTQPSRSGSSFSAGPTFSSPWTSSVTTRRRRELPKGLNQPQQRGAPQPAHAATAPSTTRLPTLAQPPPLRSIPRPSSAQLEALTAWQLRWGALLPSPAFPWARPRDRRSLTPATSTRRPLTTYTRPGRTLRTRTSFVASSSGSSMSRTGEMRMAGCATQHGWHSQAKSGLPWKRYSQGPMSTLLRSQSSQLGSQTRASTPPRTS